MWNDVSLMHAKTPATVAFSWIKTQQQKTLLTFFYLHFRTCPLSACVSLRHFTTYSTLFLNDHPNCQNPIKANAFYTYYDNKKLIWYFIHHTFISITYISDIDVH